MSIQYDVTVRLLRPLFFAIKEDANHASSWDGAAEAVPGVTPIVRQQLPPLDLQV